MVDLLRGCELPGNRGKCNNTEAKYENERVHVQVTHQSFTLNSVERGAIKYKVQGPSQYSSCHYHFALTLHFYLLTFFAREL